MTTLSPTDRAFIVGRLSDGDTDGAARELAEAYRLPADAQALLAELLGKAWSAGYDAGWEEADVYGEPIEDDP